MAQTSSAIVTATSPALVGVWLHDPTNSSGTASNFMYGNIGRTETIGVQGSPLQFIGRTYPVYDTGVFENQSLKISILVPYGPTAPASVDWFRTALRNRSTLCYRDSRGRKHYVIIVSIDFTDVLEGTAVAFTTNTVDYTEAV